MFDRAKEVLRKAGLKPTRQRTMLARLLFAGNDRHVTAGQLHEEAVECGMRISLATVYNSMNRFVEAGLLREVAIDHSKRFFDTRISSHHHLYFEDEQVLVDLEPGVLSINKLPPTPASTKITSVDILIRITSTSAPPLANAASPEEK